MESSNDRITQLQRTGFELWHRAESWRKALEKIKSLTDDPLIISFVNQQLRGNQS
jgi:hypothetical protein